MNDAISRKAVLGLCFDIIEGHQVGGQRSRIAKAFQNFAAMVEQIPEEDVRPDVRGHWKLHDDGSGTCSMCGFRQKAVWDADNAQRYCGHCGARLETGVMI